jgi:hypothetical protein
MKRPVGRPPAPLEHQRKPYDIRLKQSTVDALRAAHGKEWRVVAATAIEGIVL